MTRATVTGMPQKKASHLLSAALVLLAAPAFGEMSVAPKAAPATVLDETSDMPFGGVPGTVRPAYRFVEGISDGVFNFMRRHVLGSIFPDRFTRNLKAAPRQDSAPLFDANLREQESRFLSRARAAYPVFADADIVTNRETQLRSWRAWAAGEQASVVAGALADTLIERYQLELFGQSSGQYALDRRNWDPGFMAVAGMAGGAFLYLNGIHANANVGKFRLGVDLASGMKLMKVLSHDGNGQRMAALELGLRNVPLTLATEWGLAAGRLKNERVGLNYRLRF